MAATSSSRRLRASRTSWRTSTPRAHRPAAPASPAWESPCRSQFWRCRCGAPACGRPAGAGSDGAPGESRAPARPPAARPPSQAGTGVAGTSCGARSAGSSISRGLWHFLQRELLVLYCTSLQYSHRTTSRVSTLTRVVAIGCVRSARAGPPGCIFAPRYGATFREVNHNCQVET